MIEKFLDSHPAIIYALDHFITEHPYISLGAPIIAFIIVMEILTAPERNDF